MKVSYEPTIDFKFVTRSDCVRFTICTSPPGLHVEGISPGHSVDPQCRAGGGDGSRQECVIVLVSYTTDGLGTLDNIV